MKKSLFVKILAAALPVTLLLGSSSMAFAQTTDVQAADELQVPIVGGAVTSIVTGNFTALGMEYLERGVMLALGKASDPSISGEFSQVFAFTKKILGNPQSTALSNITNLCKQISSQIKDLDADLKKSYDYLDASIKKVSDNQDKQDYESTFNKMNSFYNKYYSIYVDYTNLVNTLQAYSENPTSENLDKLNTVYNNLINSYGNVDAQTSSSNFNFKSDLDFLLNISPYTYANPVDFTVNPSDSTKWGQKDSVNTYLDKLYKVLTDHYAFENDVYDGMVAGINQVSKYIYTYIAVYRMYVENKVIMINSDTKLSNQEKKSKCTTYWNDFNDASYKMYRGFYQMISLYDKKIQGYMRSYDKEAKIQMSYHSAEEHKYNNDQDGVTIAAQKTKSLMSVYQVKPVTDDNNKTTYIIRKKSDDTNNNITISNLISVVYDGIFATSHGRSQDYYNLLSTASPAYYNMVQSASDLNLLISSSPYDSANSNFKNFLKSQGLTNIPDGQYIIGGKETSPATFDSNCGFHDANEQWIDISKPLSKLSPNENNVILDLEDDITDKLEDNKISDSDAMVILYGQPKIAIKTEIKDNTPQTEENKNTSNILDVHQIDSNGKEIGNEISSSTILNCGTLLQIKVKPRAGEVVKSLVLKEYASNTNGLTNDKVFNDLIGNSSVSYNSSDSSQTISAEELMQNMETDSDGNYVFTIPAPYRDTIVSATFGTPDPSLQTYKATLVTDENNDIQFAQNDSVFEKELPKGTKVTVQVRPDTKKICTGLTVTKSDNTTVDVTNITDSNLIPTPTSKVYSFIMPEDAVKIEAQYVGAYTAQLNNDDSEHGSISFENVNCANDDWLKSSISFLEGDEVTVAVDSMNSVCYNSNIVVMTNENYDLVDAVPVTVKDSTGKLLYGVKFKMPAEDVTITPEFSSIKSGMHLATINNADNGYLRFCNVYDEDGDDVTINTAQRGYKKGKKVSFTANPNENYELASVKVVDNQGKEISCSEEDGVYSFTMDSRNVNISAEFEPVSNATYSVTYRYFDPEKKQYVTYLIDKIKSGDYAKIQNAPLLKNKKFIAWLSENKEFDWNTPIEGNIVLTALYKDESNNTSSNTNEKNSNNSSNTNNQNSNNSGSNTDSNNSNNAGLIDENTDVSADDNTSSNEQISETNSATPTTGDNMNIVPIASFMLLSLVSIVLMFSKRKKSN